jgi:hypothetical protein
MVGFGSQFLLSRNIHVTQSTVPGLKHGRFAVVHDVGRPQEYLGVPSHGMDEAVKSSVVHKDNVIVGLDQNIVAM